MSLAAPMGDWEIALRLLAAASVGGALGLNRDLHEKPAGLRTHALVSLGSTLVMLVSLRLTGSAAGSDPAAALRTVQGIITGIGFLGAGVILHDRVGRRVHGLTTAATLWISAGLGIACAAGEWATVLLATALIFAILIWGGPVEAALHRRLRRERAAASESCPPPSTPQSP